MLKFWLYLSIAITIFVTYMCITDGVKKWGFYYIVAAMSILMYLVRKFMMKRMEKHLEYLQEKKNNK